MIEIPEILRQDWIRFILLNGKIPIEKDWVKNNNYVWNDRRLQNHIKQNKNYGIICGKLLVIDFDDYEYQELMEKRLKPTFMVKTAGKGLHHLYYIIDQPFKKIPIKDGNNRTLADLQCVGGQVVGPGSINKDNGNKYEIIYDYHINFITYQEINEIFGIDQVKNEEILKSVIPATPKDSVIQEIKNRIKVSDCLKDLSIDTTRNPCICPFHVVKGKGCLSFSDSLGVFNCFDCGLKGDIFTLIMKKDNLTFPQAKKYFMEKLGIIVELPKKQTLTANDKPVWNFNTQKDMIDLIAENIVKDNPIYYDKANIWWRWNKTRNCWEMTDEIDIFKLIKTTYEVVGLSGSTPRNTLLNALKDLGRMNEPKEIKKSWIQCGNIIYDLETEHQFYASSEYFVTNPLPYNISSYKDTPTFDKLFTDWVGTDKVRMLYEILAYSMLSDYPIARFWALIGSGRNGKTTFLNVLSRFLGESNVTTSELDSLCGNQNRFETSKLYKKLACLMGETNFNTIKSTNLIKKLTGWDLIGGEFKNKNPFEFRNYAKIILATNSLPETMDKTDGFYRRWIIINFDNKFSDKIDILATIPEAEYENLTTKCLDYLKEIYKKREFFNEGDIEHRKRKFEENSNYFEHFIKSYLEKDVNGGIPVIKIYDYFCIYCSKKGLRTLKYDEFMNRIKAVESFEFEKPNYYEDIDGSFVRNKDDLKNPYDQQIPKRKLTLIGYKFVTNVEQISIVSTVSTDFYVEKTKYMYNIKPDTNDTNDTNLDGRTKKPDEENQFTIDKNDDLEMLSYENTKKYALFQKLKSNSVDNSKLIVDEFGTEFVESLLRLGEIYESQKGTYKILE